MLICNDIVHSSIVDAGAYGGFLRMIMESNKSVQGVIFDQPQVLLLTIASVLFKWLPFPTDQNLSASKLTRTPATLHCL